MEMSPYYLHGFKKAGPAIKITFRNADMKRFIKIDVTLGIRVNPRHLLDTQVFQYDDFTPRAQELFEADNSHTARLRWPNVSFQRMLTLTLAQRHFAPKNDVGPTLFGGCQ